MDKQSIAPLTIDQINQLNIMFADKAAYDKNMDQLWQMRALLSKQGRKQGWPPMIDAAFHTLNDLIDALLPPNGTYYPGYGRELEESNHLENALRIHKNIHTNSM